MSDYCRENLMPNIFSSHSWIVLSPIEKSIKSKVERIGKPLIDWDIQINYGIKTGLNEAFIIDGITKDALIKKSPKNAEIIRPILRGRDIKRYKAVFADLWIIATFPSLHYNIDNYPDIKEYLLSFGYDRLKQTGDNGARKKTNNKWFETQDSISYWEDFSKQKIVWKRVGSILKFSYDDTGCFALDSTCFATGKYIKYLTLVLNSKMGNYLLKDSPKTGTGDLLISVQAMEPLLIPIPSFETERIFDSLLQKIITDCETDVINQKINTMIYEMYGLSDDEINFIELQ